MGCLVALPPKLWSKYTLSINDFNVQNRFCTRWQPFSFISIHNPTIVCDKQRKNAIIGVMQGCRCSRVTLTRWFHSIIWTAHIPYITYVSESYQCTTERVCFSHLFMVSIVQRAMFVLQGTNGYPVMSITCHPPSTLLSNVNEVSIHSKPATVPTARFTVIVGLSRLCELNELWIRWEETSSRIQGLWRCFSEITLFLRM